MKRQTQKKIASKVNKTPSACVDEQEPRGNYEPAQQRRCYLEDRSHLTR
jgi:hypothetical protein